MALFAQSDPRVADSLARLDALYDDSFAWWGVVYDAQTGGCFYSISGKAHRDDPRFGPDIEATSKLVSVLEWTGLLEEASDRFKQGVVVYMQERQDPESGFFRDPQHIDQYSANTLDRAAGMANNVLRDCGAEPLYPMPVERAKDNAEAAAHFAHLESPEAFQAWMEALPWDNRVWTAGARLLTQAGLVNDLPEPKRTAMLDVAQAVLAKKQNDDGFFGSPDDAWYSRLSGSYKTVGFLVRNDCEIPRRDQFAKTVVGLLFEQDYNNSIVLYNTAKVLNLLQANGAEFTLEERLAIVDRCIVLLETMKGPDGGFVTVVGRPTPVEIGKRMGLEVIESNTNATGLAHSTRRYLIEFLTGDSGPHPHPKGAVLLTAIE